MKTVSAADLVQRIARDLKLSEPDAVALFERTIDEIRRQLQGGSSVLLPRLLTLSVRPGDAVSAATEAGGKLELPPARQIETLLDGSLSKAVQGPLQFQILIVAAKKDKDAEALALQLTSARSTVAIAAGEEEALARVKTRAPDLILIDSSMPDPRQLVAAVKRKRETNSTAIVYLCPETMRPDKLKGLAVLPDAQIREPFELADLIRLVEAELARAVAERSSYEQKLHFRFQSQSEFVEAAIDLLDQTLRSSGLPDDARDGLAVAAREALDNAARHGNKYSPDAFIDVQYALDHEKATVSVADDGGGFDTDVYLSRGLNGIPVTAARERNQTGYRGGLGIMLMLRCADRLEYNVTGNKVTLTRFLRGA